MSFYLIFIIVNAFIGLFLGLNAWAAFNPVIHNRLVFWLTVLAVTQIYWICRVVTRTYNLEMPGPVYFFVTSLFALCVVALLAVACADLILLLARVVKPLQPFFFFVKAHSVQTGIVVAALVLLYYAAGLYIANSPRETHYNIAVDKPIGVENIKIAMISDLHITTFTRNSGIKGLVERLNGLDTDLVIFAGDIIDGELQPYLDKGVTGYFSQIKSRYGVYAIMGNHEYYGGDAEKAAKEYAAAGMKVLRDEKVLLEPLGITLIGRDDLASVSFKGHSRAGLGELLAGVDMSKPVIVADHQPQNSVITEAAANGVDLQLSGHTHNGQFFPFNLIVEKIYINPWKFWSKGAYNLIVSCGFGTWGPPIRTASYAEIVVVDLNSQLQ